ncbi:Hypothetical protein BC94_0540 [Mycoplasmopsis bovis]|uniref:Uncharacterized protein n=1 Tax=Mycoplasmopsis bovis TaxID=28903 RepID=A0A8D4A3Q4_MYCBV|nr:Hypothetical protein BC85_0537 [Mycoplasmopsis bovis]AMW25806.1 Hypothetical protein BC94_0540 [Mycoplasmopsis bovis]AMW26437.1 Hypothetical protein BC93_0537 [Mycoplasmopsis bovis]
MLLDVTIPGCSALIVALIISPSLTNSGLYLNLTFLKFIMIAVTSSTIPGIVWNSWLTPEILIANSAKEVTFDNKTLLSATATVLPKPLSSGLSEKVTSFKLLLIAELLTCK